MRIATAASGDVAARVAVRFDEVVRVAAADRARSSMRLPAGARRRRMRTASRRPRTAGLGWVEGWRGEVLVALEAGAAARSAAAIRTIRRGQNWPVLEHAVIGNIVPDFPLINKSFNLTYSGHDL